MNREAPYWLVVSARKLMVISAAVASLILLTHGEWSFSLTKFLEASIFAATAADIIASFFDDLKKISDNKYFFNSVRVVRAWVMGILAVIMVIMVIVFWIGSALG